MTVGRKLNRAAKLRFLRSHPAPQRPPEGWITVHDACRQWWPSGFAPGEALQHQAQQMMSNNQSYNFRQMDSGNDYDLAARTKAARERKRGA